MLSEILSRLIIGLDSIADRIAPLLVASTDEFECRSLVEDEIMRARADIAQSITELSEKIAPQP